MRTPRVELRYPNDDEIAEIATHVVTDGVHDPAFMPFTIEWTDTDPAVLPRSVMQHHWSLRAGWKPDDWTCNFAVIVGDRFVGQQSAGAVNFATLRSTLTGSFLLRPQQGKGIGTEMRAAILHFVFAGLGAEFSLTAAFADNAPSLGVTKRLGYEYQGTRRVVSRGRARDIVDYRLSRDVWERTRRDDITIEGIEPCLGLFGL